MASTIKSGNNNNFNVFSTNSSVFDSSLNNNFKLNIKEKEDDVVYATVNDSSSENQSFQMQFDEYLSMLSGYGISDEDINRVKSGEINLQDLLKEIDKDPERVKLIQQNSFLKQINQNTEEQYESYSDFAKSVKVERNKLINLVSERNKINDIYRENDELMWLCNRLKQGDDLKSILESPACYKYKDEYGNVVYIYPDVNDGFLNYNSEIFDKKAEEVTFEEYFKNSELFDELKKTLSKEKRWTLLGKREFALYTGTKKQEAIFSKIEKLYIENYANRKQQLEEYEKNINVQKKSSDKLTGIKKYVDDQVEYYINNIHAYTSKDDFLAKSSFDKTRKKILEKSTYKISKNKSDVVDFYSCLINGEIVEKNGILTDKKNKYICDANQLSTLDNMLDNYLKWKPFISDTEKNIFNYILNTEGSDKAYRYLEDISDELDNRWLADKCKKDKEFAQEHEVLASVGSVFLTPVEGINAFAYSVNSKVTGEEIRRSDVYSKGNIWRQSVSEEIHEYSSTWGFIYDTGMSMADSGLLIAASAATGGSANLLLSATIMGSRAYVSTLNDALDRGLSDNQAILLAASSAIVETAMENYSVGHLMNLEQKLGENTLKFTAKIGGKINNPKIARLVEKSFYILASSVSQGIAEGEEEFCTELLNYGIDIFISKDLSNYAQSMERYISEGKSEDDALLLTMKDFKGQLEQAFLGGFASGVCFGAFGGANSTLKTSYGISQGMYSEFLGENVSFSDALNFNRHQMENLQYASNEINNLNESFERNLTSKTIQQGQSQINVDLSTLTEEQINLLNNGTVEQQAGKAIKEKITDNFMNFGKNFNVLSSKTDIIDDADNTYKDNFNKKIDDIRNNYSIDEKTKLSQIREIWESDLKSVFGEENILSDDVETVLSKSSKQQIGTKWHNEENLENLIRKLYDKRDSLSESQIKELEDNVYWKQFKEEEQKILDNYRKNIEDWKKSRELRLLDDDELQNIDKIDDISKQRKEYDSARYTYLLKNLGIDLDNVPDIILTTEVLGLHHNISHRIYENSQTSFKKVCMSDLVGSITRPGTNPDGTLLNIYFEENGSTFLEKFLKENRYDLRAVEYMNVDIVDKLKSEYPESNLGKSDINMRGEFIDLLEHDGKYYVSNGGNHRMVVAKLKYMQEIANAKTEAEISAINEKYTFVLPVTSLKEDSKYKSSLHDTVDMYNVVQKVNAELNKADYSKQEELEIPKIKNDSIVNWHKKIKYADDNVLVDGMSCHMIMPELLIETLNGKGLVNIFTNQNGVYTLNEVDAKTKYEVLNTIANFISNDVGQMVLDNETTLDAWSTGVGKDVTSRGNMAEFMFKQGKVEQANTMLVNLINKINDFRQDLIKSDQTKNFNNRETIDSFKNQIEVLDIEKENDFKISNKKKYVDMSSMSNSEQVNYIKNCHPEDLIEYIWQNEDIMKKHKEVIIDKIISNQDYYYSKLFDLPYDFSKMGDFYNIMSDESVIKKLSNRNLSILISKFRFTSLDMAVLKQELLRRLENGSNFIDFAPLKISSLGVDILTNGYSMGILDKNTQNKLIENINSQWNEMPEALKEFDFNLSQKAILIGLWNNKKINEKSIELMHKFNEFNPIFLKPGNINYEMFNCDVINILGIDLVMELSPYPEMTDKIITLYNNSPQLLQLWVDAHKQFCKDNSLNNLMQKTKSLLNYFYENQTNLVNLTSEFLQNNSFLDYIFYNSVKSYDAKIGLISRLKLDYSQNYERDFIKQCDEKFYSSEKIVDKKNYYCQKFFRMSYAEIQYIMTKYLDNLETLGDFSLSENAKNYIYDIKKIIEIDSIDTLTEVYSTRNIMFSVEEAMAIEQELRESYIQDYVKQLSSTSNKLNNSEYELIDYNGKKIKIIEADGDFSFFVHSSDSGFVIEKKLTDNSFKESWRQISPNTHGLSTSYISNFNIGSAPVQGVGVLYGFTDVSVGDIQLLAPYDVNSNIANYGFGSGNKEVYMSPEKLSTSTLRLYNEVVLNRNAVSPSYIIIFDDMPSEIVQNSYEAASEWGIPIVKIDKVKLAQSQMNKVIENLNAFNNSKDLSLLIKAIKLYDAAVAGYNLNIDETKNKEYLETSIHKELFTNTTANQQVKEILEKHNPTGIIYDYINKNASETDLINLKHFLSKLKSEYEFINANGTNVITRTKSSLNIDNILNAIDQRIEYIKKQKQYNDGIELPRLSTVSNKKISLINLVTELEKIVDYKDKYNYILNNYLENKLSKENIINYLDNISNEEYYNLAKEVPGLQLQNNDLITVENVKDLVVMNFTKRELFYIKWPAYGGMDINKRICTVKDYFIDKIKKDVYVTRIGPDNGRNCCLEIEESNHVYTASERSILTTKAQASFGKIDINKYLQLCDILNSDLTVDMKKIEIAKKFPSLKNDVALTENIMQNYNFGSSTIREINKFTGITTSDGYVGYAAPWKAKGLDLKGGATQLTMRLTWQNLLDAGIITDLKTIEIS